MISGYMHLLKYFGESFFSSWENHFPVAKSGFWAHILHLLGIYLYWKVVLDLRFGSARTESEEKATWIFDTYGKSAHGCQILQTWSRYLVRVWCALCRTGVLGDDRMKLDNVLGLMIEDFLEQRQDPGMSFFQQRLNHTWYLSFFLHELNFWRIKFTPKKKHVNYDKIHRKLPIFCVITAKYTVNWQFFALNL